MIRGVYIQPAARAALINETRRFKSDETGGILCGHYRDEFLVVESASGPGPGAVHSANEFVMDKEFMHAYLDQEYSTSVGLNIFVGEWHTHPQTYPEPSPQDIQSIFERSYEWTHGELVFLIIGFVGFTAEELENQIIAVHYCTLTKTFYKIPIEFI